MIFLCFGGITSCGSASLKLCVCKAASPWSQSSFPDSECLLHSSSHFALYYIASVFGQEGYTVKYTPLPEGVPKGEARGTPEGKGSYLLYIPSQVLIRTLHDFNNH